MLDKINTNSVDYNEFFPDEDANLTSKWNAHLMQASAPDGDTPNRPSKGSFDVARREWNRLGHDHFERYLNEAQAIMRSESQPNRTTGKDRKGFYVEYSGSSALYIKTKDGNYMKVNPGESVRIYSSDGSIQKVGKNLNPSSPPPPHSPSFPNKPIIDNDR